MEDAVIKYYTQWSPAPMRGIVTGDDSLVSRVPSLPVSARVAQQMLVGLRIDAHQVGYDYRADDKLPDEIHVRPGRSADVVELMGYISSFGARLREAVAAQAASKPATGGTAATPGVTPGEPATSPVPGAAVPSAGASS